MDHIKTDSHAYMFGKVYRQSRVISAAFGALATGAILTTGAAASGVNPLYVCVPYMALSAIKEAVRCHQGYNLSRLSNTDIGRLLIHSNYWKVGDETEACAAGAADAVNCHLVVGPTIRFMHCVSLMLTSQYRYLRPVWRPERGWQKRMGLP